MTLALFLFDHNSKENLIRSKVVNPGLVDGVVVTATRTGIRLFSDLQDAGVPAVVVGRLIDEDAMSSVDVDNEGGARQAALHLARLGRERLGFIGAPADTSAGTDRYRGFLEGLEEAGLSLEGRFQEGAWTQESGRIAMEKLLADRPDAVFASSDRMAVGALRAVHDAGLHCPDDVAIVGFDDLIPPDQTVPELTTVSQPVFQVGVRAAELLKAVIDGTVRVPERIVYPTKLVVRQSCGASRSEAS
jgi:LacI family repressor for deo operon, udp, cdd, tsx, nupC, and nupG